MSDDDISIRMRAILEPSVVGSGWNGRVITTGKAMVWTCVGVVNNRVNHTLTLNDPDDTKRIHVGMRLRAGVDARLARDGEFVVHRTNEETGTITVEDATAVTSFADGDSLFFVAEIELGRAK